MNKTIVRKSARDVSNEIAGENEISLRHLCDFVGNNRSGL